MRTFLEYFLPKKKQKYSEKERLKLLNDASSVSEKDVIEAAKLARDETEKLLLQLFDEKENGKRRDA